LVPIFKKWLGGLGVMGIPGALLALSLSFTEKNFFSVPISQGHDVLWII
jgi:hypothetical protein